MNGRRHTRGVLLTGSDRYSCPLSATEEKKFRLLAQMAPHYVLSFTPGWWPRRFKQHATFYLLPDWPFQRLRQALFLVTVFLATLYFALFRGVRTVMSQTVYDAVPLLLASRLLHLVRCRVAVVIQIHGDFEEGLLLLKKFPAAVMPFVRLIIRFSLRNADVIRPISDFTLKKAKKYMKDEKPVVVFPGFTDIDLFLAVEKRPAGPSLPQFLYAGVLTPLKGVHVLINALGILKEDGLSACLVIAGLGQERDRLCEQAAKAGVAHQVSFVGFVQQKELRQFMTESDALVLPTLSEGFGRVVIEAMACQTPVIASRTGGIPEIISDQETGLLVEPGDPKTLAEKMAFVIQQPDAAQRLGLNGRRFVQRYYSNAAYIENYRRLLEVARR